MSRRGKTIVKRVVLDPKFNSELVAHMIRVIMKDGKKTVAEKIVWRIPPSSSRTRSSSRIRSRSFPPRSTT